MQLVPGFIHLDIRWEMPDKNPISLQFTSVTILVMKIFLPAVVSFFNVTLLASNLFRLTHPMITTKHYTVLQANLFAYM